MKGFFLLFTISLLVMLQIQRGMLETTAPGMVTTTSAPATTATRNPAAPRTPARTPARTNAAGTTAAGNTAPTTPTVNPSPSLAATKKQTGAAPALSSLGGVSILIILTNTFIQLFHLS
ncbi:CAMPATH-1 antigen-like [Artibeus jamaicensis]|uniref:CAMPATH-1 antigen-like n=1 Tax=Artibeus jamaicensis TaxID=9417 RepID=UPI00235A6BA5|nr:CAMPATH-1 antigen-like [Artibeus jamaicensis]